MGNKVVLGLSGGVDSAVAARLLQLQGFDVFGLYLDIGNHEAREDAKKVSEMLNIPLHISDISNELEEKVCKPFTQAYLRGETPNPCILCNPTVKFKTLLEYSDKIGASIVSTGHYARAFEGKLLKGKPENDQSYMLCRLTRDQISRLVLPLGDYNKEEVRKLAQEFSIPVANKPASMEICFIPDKDYGAFIEGRGIIPPEGNFVDTDGNILGKHLGIHRYTIGQRRGLGVAAGKRIFVSEIRPEKNEVVLSDGDELFVHQIKVIDINWILPQNGEFKADVRVRHSKVSNSASVLPDYGGVDVVFDEPVRAPTKGQTAAFYIGDEVIGGGFII